ncbi:hypothetical protein MN116_007193 [Schistosoma mekongi]|uniref:RING-type domain-containing protein n=1 Tax=Schistosoma mekongi TaxID=38744 RepID=A0AAE1Z9H8_SCHME|nr:hypothetical protein MN116_007193 [Schistosoma mekongi]
MTSTMMSSRLVETVMINVDDFADNFLTCGTCFSGYNSNERAAKLLPCSHTICRSCLDRILTNETQTETFRCPICRENIAIPSGGAASFPPAFIVNQLLDLLATHRHDVVPKCFIHPSQELLFCETCDMVFCSECRGRNHAVQNHVNDSLCLPVNSEYQDVTTAVESSSSNAGLNHNVISFNVALKRCSEIMLYKMHLCTQELNCAQEAVTSELERLTNNTSSCVESINSRFSEILALVEHRQGELLDCVKRLGEEKRRALTDQLSLIETERELIRTECDRLKGVMDVRSITKTISYLNDKLDSISSLTEPRENAFLCYQDCVGQYNHHNHVNMCCTALKRTMCSSTPSVAAGNYSEPPVTCHNESNLRYSPSHHNHQRLNGSSSSTLQSSHQVSLPDIARCLAGFGRLVVSTTYPALCTARLPSEMFTHLSAKCTIQAVDYNGRPQTNSGTDPIEVTFTDPRGHLVPTDILDIGSGCYELSMISPFSGIHKLSIKILNRPIRGSPFSIHVKPTQKRIWSLKDGSDGRGLIQPFAVAYGPYPVRSSEASSDAPQVDCSTPGDFIYVLDTGNSRLLVLNPADGSLHATVTGEPLSGQAATGIVWSPDGLWIVNWRTKQLFLLDPATEQVVSSISSPLFKEPTSITRCPLTNRLFIADNGAGCIFVSNPETCSVNVFIETYIFADGTLNTSTRHSTLIRAEANAHLTQPRVCKLITGLCVADSGELILSTGTCIRIFSSDGHFLADLLPPNQLNDDHMRVRISTLPARASLDASYYNALNISRDNPDTECTNLDRLSLSELRHSSGSGKSRPASSRGQFGGVSFSIVPTESNNSVTDKLGKCILATYSDRQRSGVVVWPESLWTSCCRQSVHEVDDNTVFSSMITGNNNNINNNTVSNTTTTVTTTNVGCSSNNNRFLLVDPNLQTHTCAIYCPLNRSRYLFKPYLIEVDSPFRRLAGLVALSNCRDVIVVDQGAQNISRMHYA